MSTLQIEAGLITTLILNRPDKLNALDYATIASFSAALERSRRMERSELSFSPEDRAFIAGADIDGLARSIGKGQDAALHEIVARAQGLTRLIEAFPKPIICSSTRSAKGIVAFFNGVEFNA